MCLVHQVYTRHLAFIHKCPNASDRTLLTFLYQYINAPVNEAIFPDVGLRTGPSLGVRFDATESIAFKLQYDYTALRRQPGINGLGLQVGFTF